MALFFGQLAAGLLVLCFVGRSDALSAHGCSEGRCGQHLTVVKEQNTRIELSCEQGVIQVIDGFFGR